MGDGREQGDALTLLFPPTLGQIRAQTRAEVLSGSLGRRLGRPVKVDVAESYEQLERAVLAAEVDLAWAPPSICAAADPDAAAIFKVVRFGESSYNAAFVGRAVNPPSMDGLQGARAAWVDPLSAGGYLLAVAHLREAGLEPSELFSSEKFFGSYQGALLSVLSGNADITTVYAHGKTDAAARRTLVENVGASASHLKPIAFTGAAPADGLIATSRLRGNEALLAALERAVDGSLGPTLLLELFEADRLERAERDEYQALRLALAPKSAAS